MTSVLASAFAQGFTEEQVIKYLVRHSPKYAKQIASATGVGYTPKQILRYLTKDNPKERAATTEYEEMRGRDQKNRSNANKAVIGGAVAATGLPIAASAGSAALSRALPQTLKNIAPQIAHAMGNDASNPNMTSAQPTQEMPQTPSNQTPVNASQQPPSNQVAASIPQPGNIPQSKGFDTKSIKNSLGNKSKIDNLINSGNGADEIDAYLRKFDPAVVKSIEKDTKVPLKDAIQAYIDEGIKADVMNPPGSRPDLEKQNQAKIGQIPQDEEKISPEIEKPVEPSEPVKIEKNSVVSSPNGIGEVKAIKENTALIDIDGKLTKVDVKDLESEPPDIAELYDNLFNAIPKEYQSRMMNYAGYDEDANELIFRPHGGAAYVYKDIPPQFAEDLKNRLHNAKTTGKNMYGMWNEGDPSYGAGMSALIKELQKVYGGKGKEYVRKYNTLFDILGIPHEEKKRKEQEERRKRKANG